MTEKRDDDVKKAQPTANAEKGGVAAELESAAAEDVLLEEALFEAPTEPRHSAPTLPPEALDSAESDWELPTVPDLHTLDWDPDERG